MGDQGSRISVILPVFNGAAHLEAAVASVLAQTLPADEIILIDDGSSDEGCLPVASLHPKITLFRQDNLGTAAARNQGVKLARGDFLAFLDQDDLWISDKLEQQMMAFAVRPELDMVFGRVRQFQADAPPPRLPSCRPCSSEDVPGLLPSALLIRRTSFAKVGPFDSRWRIGEWSEWYTRACRIPLRMALPDHLVALRRQHAGNKGRLQREHRREYAQLLKLHLDARRDSARASH